MTTPSRTRIRFIDVARTYAIVLALLSHALLATGFSANRGFAPLLVKQITRTATPMFVFMFGFMVEYVYVPRARAAAVLSLRRRLLVRAFQCYVGYALASLTAWLGGCPTGSSSASSSC